MLHGHERAITQIKYNREGDLLFTASKDPIPNVWYSLNGERLGTFNGHGGVVWCIDVDWQSTKFISGGGDNTLRLWNVQTGKETGQIKTFSSVRSCNFSYSANMAAYATDTAMGYSCELNLIDVRSMDDSGNNSEPILKILISGSRVSSFAWGTLDEIMITGHENGCVKQWDLRVNQNTYLSSNSVLHFKYN